MQPDREQSAHPVTARGHGQFHRIDPRTGREPAGSSLLARDSAVRQAQEAAFRTAIDDLARDKPAWAHGDAERLKKFVEDDLVPRVRDFIERRWVVEEAHNENGHFVTLNVVFDLAAVNAALERFNG